MKYEKPPTALSEQVELLIVRTQWVDVLAQAHGAHAYLKSPLFANYGQYGRSLAELAREFDQSKETCAPTIPGWGIVRPR